jgi:3-oxoacyl-[acyl-carrier protein] reductase
MTNRAILVTGASKGIGAAVIRHLAKENRAPGIAMVARQSDYYDDFVREMRTQHQSVAFTPFFADLGREEDVTALLDGIRKSKIEIFGLINNAGYTNPKSINQIETNDFEYTLRTNLVSPFRLVQFLVKEFAHKLQFVLNVSSTAGISGRAGWLTYSASKAAMINMSEVMREELKVYGTRVICISPGRCATDLRRTLAPDEDPNTIMQPEEVAAVVDTLISGVGRMIDSHNIVVRR